MVWWSVQLAEMLQEHGLGQEQCGLGEKNGSKEVTGRDGKGREDRHGVRWDVGQEGFRSVGHRVAVVSQAVG